ncbi:MAG: hypothetical protein GXP49_07750 [Deltaproteobacteria bacterium]|nr:hypothetical protein [Deltaproteobacteria bacterium]
MPADDQPTGIYICNGYDGDTAVICSFDYPPNRDLVEFIGWFNYKGG